MPRQIVAHSILRQFFALLLQNYFLCVMIMRLKTKTIEIINVRFIKKIVLDIKKPGSVIQNENLSV